MYDASFLRVVFVGVGIAIACGTASLPFGRVGLSAETQHSNSRLERAPLVHRVLDVGPGRRFAKPSEAAVRVQTGDIVSIAAGTYEDCAVWPRHAAFVTIESAGGTVRITGDSCENKALFVIKGDNVTVRGLIFTGATAFHHNGAGIRAEGGSLTVENSQFIDNEEGILAGSMPDATIAVTGGLFKGNGNCVEDCAHGIYVGKIGELHIEHSHFIEQHVGHHVKSRAQRTVLIENTIDDGSFGTSSYLVDIPNGGALVMHGNVLQKGPLSENPGAAIVLGEEGASNPTPEILIENNTFTNAMTATTVFVRNRTMTTPVLRANTLIGAIKSYEGPATGTASP